MTKYRLHCCPAAAALFAPAKYHAKRVGKEQDDGEVGGKQFVYIM